MQDCDTSIAFLALSQAKNAVKLLRLVLVLSIVLSLCGCLLGTARLATSLRLAGVASSQRVVQGAAMTTRLRVGSLALRQQPQLAQSSISRLYLRNDTGRAAGSLEVGPQRAVMRDADERILLRSHKRGDSYVHVDADGSYLGYSRPASRNTIVHYDGVGQRLGHDKIRSHGRVDHYDAQGRQIGTSALETGTGVGPELGIAGALTTMTLSADKDPPCEFQGLVLGCLAPRIMPPPFDPPTFTDPLRR